MRQNTLHYDCFAEILRKSNQVRQHNGYRNTEKVQLPKRALHQCVLLFQGNRWRYVLWTWKKYFQATYQRINIQNILTSQKVQQQISLCSEEMHEGPQQTVHKRRTIANKYISPVSPVIREMKIKTQWDITSFLSDWALSKRQSNKHWGGYREKGKHVNLLSYKQSNYKGKQVQQS